jgi:hypothetical protein
MSTELFVLALLAALLALNVAITLGVVRSEVYTPRQKTMQLALVWLLLVLGPVLVGVVLWSDRAPRARRRRGGRRRGPDRQSRPGGRRGGHRRRGRRLARLTTRSHAGPAAAQAQAAACDAARRPSHSPKLPASIGREMR